MTTQSNGLVTLLWVGGLVGGAMLGSRLWKRHYIVAGVLGAIVGADVAVWAGTTVLPKS